MSTSYVLSSFFNNKFEPHYFGNYALYGLNTFGCNSIIMFRDEIWKFCYFKHGSDIPYYVNKDGTVLGIEIWNENNITRMQICS